MHIWHLLRYRSEWHYWQNRINSRFQEIILIARMTFSSFPSCLMSKSQWRLPLTLTGVMSTPSSGMTIHTLVLTVDSFSCNYNSMNSLLSIDFLEHFSLNLSYCCMCINTSVFSNVNHFNFVQQCIQISTRINSSMYICTSAFVSFETYPIFNNI